MENGKTSDWKVSEIIVSETYEIFQYIPLAIGLLLAVFFFFGVLGTLFRRCCSSPKFFPEMWDRLTASSSAWADTRLKRAATRKINNLLVNAHRLHRPNAFFVGSSLESAAGHVQGDQTMHNYVLDEERTEVVGGAAWTWSKLLDGTLFDTEGIWLNTRLLIIQVAQVILILFVSVFMLASVKPIADNAQESRDALDPSVPDWVRDLVPTKRKCSKFAPCSKLSQGLGYDKT